MKKYVDLTVPIMTGHWRYPNVMRPHKSTDAGDATNVTYYELRSHWFTHIDAPSHVTHGGKTLDDFDISLLIGPAYMAYVENIAPNEAIDAERLKQAMVGFKEEKILIVKTCWGAVRDWKSEEFWDEAPYLTKDAAEYLLGFKPNVVGYDFPQDYDIRKIRNTDEALLDLTTHEVLLKNGVLMLEYLNYLWNVPVKNVEIYALPLKLGQADGAQVRVVAAYEEGLA